jgi:hypothetical protein
MKAAHHQPVRQRLEKEGFNLNEMESVGQLVCSDATELLDTFMIGGAIDEYRLRTAAGDMILKARVAGNKRRPVRVFGEMVDLIWTTNPTATLHLEQLWDQLADLHAVPLLCTYSLAGPRRARLTPSLLACHSHAIA